MKVSDMFSSDFKLKVEPRDGKYAIWVEMADGKWWNIWDTPKPPTELEMNLVRSGLERGYRMAEMKIQNFMWKEV
jgi:hypothetical protein